MNDRLPQQPGPIVIGLVGGIASGKSTVAGMFGARGFTVLDADAEARRVTDDPAVARAIAERLGPAAAPGGRVDRAALARIVFGDPAARAALEAIVHPRVRARLLQRLDEARASGSPVVLDVPLLLEGGLIERCDTCVFVDAAPEVRQARARGRGWDVGELARRERAQADLAVKQARCPHRIRTDGPLEDVHRQVEELLGRLGLSPPGAPPT